MACRGDNAKRCGDEESSSSSFEVSREVLSRADANEILTWLRPIGEFRANAF